MNRIVSFSLSLTLGLLALPAVAQQTSSPDQSSGSSLADYARQVRKDVPKGKPKVFDNDNLPTEDKLSVIGTAPETASNAADAKPAEATGAAPAAAGATAKTEALTAPAAGDTKATEKSAKSPDDEQKEKHAAWKQWQEKLAAQKESIDLITRELDVLQREYQIRAAAMYADAGNRIRNSTDWDKQDAQYKQQIADKTKSLEEAKQKMDDMQEDARKAGVPASMRD
jgi:hypothetical protein